MAVRRLSVRSRHQWWHPRDHDLSAAEFRPPWHCELYLDRRGGQHCLRLYVGTAPSEYNIYGALPSATSQSVAGVPTSGTVDVRLWTNFAGGWQFVDYTYR